MHMHIVVNLVQHSMFVEVLMSLIFEWDSSYYT